MPTTALTLALAELKGPTKKAQFLAKYVGAQGNPKRKPDEVSSLIYWGHPIPKHRLIARKITKLIFNKTGDEQWSIWLDLFYSSQLFDIKNIALIGLSSPALKKASFVHVKDLIQLANHVDNWAISDSLSSLLASVFEHQPRTLWSTYQTWNRSQNPWLRRQSLVGIYCYARLRKTHWPAKKSLKLVKALLLDPHVYVQKGVGWTLREIDRIDSKAQRSFVEKNLNQISPEAWFATRELYPKWLALSLREKRKTLRST